MSCDCIKDKNRQINALQAEKGRLQRALKKAKEKNASPSGITVNVTGATDPHTLARRYNERLTKSFRDTYALSAAPVTAREHLDAAWEAAHVPAGPIPMGTRYMLRLGPGVYLANRAMGTIRNYKDYRLLDPPTPTRPEGARDLDPIVLDTLREHGQAPDGETVVSISDALAERGVRALEGGEER